MVFSPAIGTKNLTTSFKVLAAGEVGTFREPESRDAPIVWIMARPQAFNVICRGMDL